VRKANGNPATRNLYNSSHKPMNPKKKTTPLEEVSQAWCDAIDPVQFSQWYAQNKLRLENDEKQLIIDTWDEAIDDATQDIDHAFNGAEYWTIHYQKP